MSKPRKAQRNWQVSWGWIIFSRILSDFKPSFSYNFKKRSKESDAAIVDTLTADNCRRYRRKQNFDDAAIRDINRHLFSVNIYLAWFERQ